MLEIIVYVLRDFLSERVQRGIRTLNMQAAC